MSGDGRGTATGTADDGPRGFVANRVRRGFYLDSVVLMRISASLSGSEGVETASLMIGTPSNLVILGEAGLLTEAGRAAGPDDLIIAVRAENEESVATALDEAEGKLTGAAAGPEGGGAVRFPGIRAACEALPGANLAIVSVPGPFAAREAKRALAAGLHVLVFSDNVPVAEEVALKREAGERGLMAMGPDCGTAIIAGTPFAFANRVRPGDIGAIAASGTGLQELSVLVHRGGGGLSHGIGVGGRDLGDEVGGLGTFMALDILEADPDTRHIVIVSKPPGPRTEAALRTRLADCPKAVTLCLVGRDDGDLPPNATLAPTLRDAARLALRSTTASPAVPDADGVGGSVRATPGAPYRGAPGRTRLPGTGSGSQPRGRILGLYSGGTLCAEGQTILRRAGLEVSSNAPTPGTGRVSIRLRPGTSRPWRTPPELPAATHLFLDLGADEYTAGRPHPMIEPALRAEVLAGTLADPTIAVLVVDVVLGTGSHLDPAGVIARTIELAPHGHPPIVASVCGTELDPQNYDAQRRTLERIGVFVAESNADAVEAAIRIAMPEKEESKCR